MLKKLQNKIFDDDFEDINESGNECLNADGPGVLKFEYINFKNHPVLGDLFLDFRDRDGQAADTIIIAGENGTGKSNVINGLYGILAGTSDFECEVGMQIFGVHHHLSYAVEIINRHNAIWVTDQDSNYQGIQGENSDLINHYGFRAILSDVDINFQTKSITNVTSMSLDEENQSRRSSNDLANSIKQLLIDIDSLDAEETALAVKRNPDTLAKDLPSGHRMSRFTNAFNYMFDHMPEYDHIENIDGKKEVIFQKDGKQFTLDSLSSGEKQIVFRGAFLLKDINALSGAVVFIDEPEISLHPNWQKKILGYYKRIFTDSDGQQTSQIFVVTHSPFVIHNKYRSNEKVIVLARDGKGRIYVEDKPEYYNGGSVTAVEDAFYIHDFNSTESFVYLEGRTDEKYYKKTIEAYHLNLPFQFRWIGYFDDKGDERSTGETALKNAYEFLVMKNLPVKNFCLFDCDTGVADENRNNVYKIAMQQFDNSKNLSRGIENALIVDEIDLGDFYSTKEDTGPYGEKKAFQTFEKMSLCDYICGLDNEAARPILLHLKEEIDKLLDLYKQ